MKTRAMVMKMNCFTTHPSNQEKDSWKADSWNHGFPAAERVRRQGVQRMKSVIVRPVHIILPNSFCVKQKMNRELPSF